MLIQIFVEAGYERKEIIPIIKQGDSGLLKELDTLIAVLEDKRKRIDGMINYIKVSKEIPGMPRVVQRALSKIDTCSLFGKKSFSQQLEESIKKYAELDSEEEDISIEDLSKVTTIIIAIGCLKDTTPNSEDVQKCVTELLKIVARAGVFDDEISYVPGEDFPEDIRHYMVAAVLKNYMTAASEDEDEDVLDFIRELEMRCGENAFTFVIEALNEYLVEHNSIEEDYEIVWRENG